MALVNRQFVSALRSRLGGKFEEFLSSQNGSCSMELARRAGVDEKVLLSAGGEVLGIAAASTLAGRRISSDFVARVPIAFARRYAIIGLAASGDHVEVALSDLRHWPHLQTIASLIGRKITPLLAPQKEILSAINSAYQQSSQAQQMIEQLGEEASGSDEPLANEDLLDLASRTPVIKLVNLILLEAVKRRASDVHVQPDEDSLVVRMRIDGILRSVFTPPKAMQPEIISRIKVMGGMNIAEQRLAQDGRATVEVGDAVVDLRISTLPTSHGERAVIRLLDKSIRLFELQELGMPAPMFETFRKLIHLDHGIILVTGPTGSGKSTTLYAALQEINSQEMNILTLEDPIEYRLAGISQTQVNTRKGMTFASGLRHVLRQDPDILMVGEIRDAETAQMAIQSALTGHLVFSTLHTNDAAGAVARMLDLGVEPYLLASSLLGVLAQRLVRLVCKRCRGEFEVTPADRRRWNLADGELLAPRLVRGAGCESCLHTGYSGRQGIFELLTVNEAIRDLVLHRSRASSLKAEAAKHGMTSLRSDGLRKVLEGATTMDEVTRVTSRDDF